MALRPNEGMLANNPNLQHSSAAGGLNVALLGHAISQLQPEHESWFREVQSGGRCMGVGGKQSRVVLCGYVGLLPTISWHRGAQRPIRTYGRLAWAYLGEAAMCGNA